MNTIYQLPTWAETVLVICVAIMLAGLSAFLAMKAITEAINAESKLQRKRKESESKALDKWERLYQSEKTNHLNDVADLINANTRLMCENRRMKELLGKVKVADL